MDHPIQTNTLPDGSVEINPRCGAACILKKGQRLRVIDVKGMQVSDLMAFNEHDHGEWLSNGRTFDYADRIFITKPDPLYSNRSRVMLKIVEDTCGKNDFTLTPCSKDTFRIIYGDKDPHRGCFGNLCAALEPYGINPDQITVREPDLFSKARRRLKTKTAFNCFMNCPLDGTTGKFSVQPPTSKAGDYIDFVAEMDCLIGMTACSALQSNGGSFKPIQYKIFEE